MTPFRSALVFLLAAAAYAQTNEAALTAGWDDRSFHLFAGRVLWSVTADASGRLNVTTTFELNGSTPNHRFTAGAHFFDPGGNASEVSVFGGNKLGGKGSLTRDGRTAMVTGAWDFGALATDAAGNARAEFVYSVPNRAYAAEFTVRRGAACPAQGPDCACVFRTGGRFAADLARFGSATPTANPALGNSVPLPRGGTTGPCRPPRAACPGARIRRAAAA